MGWLVLLIISIVAIGGFLWWTSSKAPVADQGATGSSNAALNTVTDKASAAPEGNTPATATSDSTAASGANAGATKQTPAAPMTATVTYDGSSFSPASITIAQGGTVTFTDTSGQMWVASNPHPVHDGYDGTTRDQHCAAGYAGAAPFDECSPGLSYSFTFNKTGSWGYHDHLNHSAVGTVTVVAAQ